MNIDRVTSIDKIKGIRNKKSYFLVLTRIENNRQTKIDGCHFLVLNRKAIKKKINEYIYIMQENEDIDLYVLFENESEQLMTITKKDNEILVIDDTKNPVEWIKYNQ